MIEEEEEGRRKKRKEEEDEINEGKQAANKEGHEEGGRTNKTMMLTINYC